MHKKKKFAIIYCIIMGVFLFIMAPIGCNSLVSYLDIDLSTRDSY